jgi:preprotein translocase subunit SecG
MNYEAVILVIHLIVAVSMIVVIMVQPSDAGGFLGTGSMSNMMAPRRSADVMTRTTTILAGLFFATSLLLAIAANHHPASKSILDVNNGAKKEQMAPAPANDTNTITNTTNTTDTGKKTDKPAKSDIPKAPQTK